MLPIVPCFEPLIKSVMEHFRGTRFPPPTRLGPVLEDSQGRYLGGLL